MRSSCASTDSSVPAGCSSCLAGAHPLLCSMCRCTHPMHPDPDTTAQQHGQPYPGHRLCFPAHTATLPHFRVPYDLPQQSIQSMMVPTAMATGLSPAQHTWPPAPRAAAAAVRWRGRRAAHAPPAPAAHAPMPPVASCPSRSLTRAMDSSGRSAIMRATKSALGSSSCGAQHGVDDSTRWSAPPLRRP